MFSVELPIVTIITPSYNQAQYLESTICSVIGQDYPAIEYIIIDAGSKDGSVDIIRRYESHLAYWISEPDSGQSEAINKGMARASGKYVAWLNSDDIYLPGAVSKAVAAFAEKSDAGMVYANGVGIDSEGNQTDWPIYDQYSLIDLLAMRIIHQPTVFMQRKIVQMVSGLDPSYHLLMDHHLWIRIARKSPIFFVDQYWAGARRHALAKNSTRRSGFAVEARRILSEMSNYEDVASLIAQHPHRIEAGQRVFDAGYLLVNGHCRSALRGLLSAIYIYPGVICGCWRLMLLSLMGALNFGGEQAFLYKFRARIQRVRFRHKTL